MNLQNQNIFTCPFADGKILIVAGNGDESKTYLIEGASLTEYEPTGFQNQITRT